MASASQNLRDQYANYLAWSGQNASNAPTAEEPEGASFKPSADYYALRNQKYGIPGNSLYPVSLGSTPSFADYLQYNSTQKGDTTATNALQEWNANGGVAPDGLTSGGNVWKTAAQDIGTVAALSAGMYAGVSGLAGAAGAAGAGGATAGSGAAAGTGAAAGSLEMAPAWTAAETAAAGAGGAGAAEAAAGAGTGTGAWTAEDLAAAQAGIPASTAAGGAGGVTAGEAVAAAPLAQQLASQPNSGNQANWDSTTQYPIDPNTGQPYQPSNTGNGTSGTDYWRMAGQVLPSLISAYGSNEQRKSQEQLAAEYRAMGAPYRDRLAALYANPNVFLTSPEVTVPVQQGTDSLARALSVKGNPAGSGTALQEIQNYSANQLFGKLGQEKDRLAGFGGLSFYNQAAPGASQAAITAQGQVYGDIGYGVGNVMNPQQYNNNQSLAAILKAYNTSQGLS